MAEMKKYLDQKGVEHLWSKLSMEDYPNNETLMAVINAIDETKADKSEIENLASETYVDEAINNIDIPNEIYINNEAPENPKEDMLWLDTDEKAAVSGGSGGGGVTSWNELEDKPEGIGYFEKTNINAHFDGDLTGKVVLPLSEELYFVKITDQTLTKDKIVDGEIVIKSFEGDTEFTYPTYTIQDLTEQYGLDAFAIINDGTPMVIFVETTGTVTELGVEISAGIYYAYMPNLCYVCYFSPIEGYIHKIPDIYIPDTVVSGKNYFNYAMPVFNVCAALRSFMNISANEIVLSMVQNKTLDMTREQFDMFVEAAKTAAWFNEEGQTMCKVKFIHYENLDLIRFDWERIYFSDALHLQDWYAEITFSFSPNDKPSLSVDYIDRG